MKKTLLIVTTFIIIMACGGGPTERPANSSKAKKEEPKPANDKGIGEITHVDLNDPLDASMVEKGKGIYELKCSACHKATSQRVVGPGFAGVTTRRTPEWIMNMVTNVEVMLEQDPEARELLKQCLVRMPNQNLTMEDSRNVLEWMYENDNTSN